MKTLFIRDLAAIAPGAVVQLDAWVAGRRHLGRIILADSTGRIQAVIESHNEHLFSAGLHVPIESSITIKGVTQHQVGSSSNVEVQVTAISTIGLYSLTLDPQPRSTLDIFDSRYANHLLRHKHIPTKPASYGRSTVSLRNHANFAGLVSCEQFY